MKKNNAAFRTYGNYHRIFKPTHEEMIFPPFLGKLILRSMKGAVLDIGTGDGFKLAHLLSRVPAGAVGSVTAADPSPLVRQARQRLGPFDAVVLHDDWRGLAAGARKKNKRYDVILAFEVLEHMTGQDEFLAAVGRMLSPSGVFICSTPNRPVYRFLCRLIGERPDPTHVAELDEKGFRKLIGLRFESRRFLGFFPFMKLFRKLPFLDIVNRIFPFLFWSRTMYAFCSKPVPAGGRRG